MVAVVFVESELLARAHTLEEIGALRLGVGQLIKLVPHIGDGALEAFIDLAFRPFDISQFALALVAFALEHNLAAVGISVSDLMPYTYCIVVLLRRIYLHLHGELVVLAQHILHGVEVVLTHIGESATVVVPVAAESLMSAMDVVRLEGSRAQPHIIVELCGHGLRREVVLAHPEEFPCEARGAGDGHLQRPSEQSALDELLKRFDGSAEAIERVGETEPGVQTEDATVALDSGFHGLAFADGARHRFLEPDILTGLGGFHGHKSVPVWRRGNVNDIGARLVHELSPVIVAFDVDAEILLGSLDGTVEVILVDIADGEQAIRLRVREMARRASDASHADDRFRQLVAGGYEALSAQHFAWHDGEQPSSSHRLHELSSIHKK